MNMKPKGRKLYRMKDKIAYKKKRRNEIRSAIITILIAVLMGFAGYFAGKPVLQFLRENHLISPPPCSGTVLPAES